MPTVDHLSIGVPDIEAGCKFYDGILELLQVKCLAAGDGFAAYGRERIEFLLLLPFDGGAPTGGNGTHIALAAPSRKAVDAAYKAALASGGTDEDAPGPRDAYPIPDVYTSYVRDPFGNKLEMIHNGFVGQ